VFLLVPAYPGCPGTKVAKRLLLLLLLLYVNELVLVFVYYIDISDSFLHSCSCHFYVGEKLLSYTSLDPRPNKGKMASLYFCNI